MELAWSLLFIWELLHKFQKKNDGYRFLMINLNERNFEKYRFRSRELGCGFRISDYVKSRSLLYVKVWHLLHGCFVPVIIYLFQVNNRNTQKMCEICFFSCVSIVGYEQVNVSCNLRKNVVDKFSKLRK